MKRHFALRTAVLFGLAGIALTGCSSPATSGEQSPSASAAAAPTMDQTIHDQLPASIKDAGVIRIGATTTNPPFSLKAGQDLVGLIPDLATRLESVMGVKVEFVETAFPGLIPALQADRIDAIWTLLTDTAEREKTLNFVSYMHISSSLLVPQGTPQNISDLDDLCGKTVANLRGAIHITYIDKQTEKCKAEGKPEVTQNLYDDSGTAQTQLRAGKVDAYFGFRAPVQYVADKVDNGKAFEVLDGKYEGGFLGIAVDKDNADLAAALQAGLKEVVETGGYEEVLKSHNVADEGLKAEQIVVNGITSGELK